MAQPENYADLEGEALAAICAQRPAIEDAWAAFYLRFRTPVPRRLRKLGFPAADVEDLTQEVFLQVFQFLPSFRPGGAPLEALIFQFTNHVAIDQWRRRAMEGRTVSIRDELSQAAAQRGIPSATVAVLVRLAVESFPDARIRNVAEEIARDTEVEEICRKLNEKKHFVYAVRKITEQTITQQFEAYLQEKTKISR